MKNIYKTFKFFISFLLLVNVTISKADVSSDNSPNPTDIEAYAQSIQFFSSKDLTTFNLQRLPIRSRLQDLFIDDIVLKWINQNKRLPTKLDFNSDSFPSLDIDDKKTPSEIYLDPTSNKINISLDKLLNNEETAYIGLFSSIKDLRNKIVKRIETLDIVSEYSYLFEVHNKKPTLINNEKDLQDPAKRSIIKKLFIDCYLMPWVNDNEDFPSSTDFTKKPDGVGLTYRVVFTPYSGTTKLGIFDSIFQLRDDFYSRIKELGLDKKYSYLINKINKAYIIQLLQTQDLKNPTIKARIQRIWILEQLLPWMIENKKFPETQDFKTSATGLGFSFHKIFKTKYSGEVFFHDLLQLKQITLQVLEEEYIFSVYPTLHDIFYPPKFLYNSSSNKKNEIDSDKRRLQRAFIMEHIFPWMRKSLKLPELYNFGTAPDQIGIPAEKILPLGNNKKPLFLGVLDLRRKTLSLLYELDKELLKTILEDLLVNKPLTTSELDNIKIRELLQIMCIEKYVIPWMRAHDNRYPSGKDFGLDKDQVGITYTKILGEKHGRGANKVLFSSMAELREKTFKIRKQQKMQKYYQSINIDDENNKDRLLDTPISQEDLSYPERRRVLQKLFIRDYAFIWMKRNNGRLPTKNDYGTESGKIGLNFKTVFGTRSDEGQKQLGIFESEEQLKEELKECTSLFIDFIADDTE